MAKTIAMQRGTASISSTSPVTLFTQSGGYATKVICNQLVFYAASGNLYYPVVELALYSASGPRTSLGIIYTSSSSTGAIQFLPHAGQHNAAHPIGQYNQQYGTVNTSVGNATSGTSTGTSPNPGYYQAGSLSIMINVPTEFYIGPSDSLVAKYQNDNGSNIQVGWSFTTITET